MSAMDTPPSTGDAPRDDPPPLEPVMPDLDDCCGQGCDPCVFDVYEEKRGLYLTALRAWQSRHAATPEERPREAPGGGPLPGPA
jgi:hypothetical protein